MRKHAAKAVIGDHTIPVIVHVHNGNGVIVTVCGIESRLQTTPEQIVTGMVSWKLPDGRIQKLAVGVPMAELGTLATTIASVMEISAVSEVSPLAPG